MDESSRRKTAFGSEQESFWAGDFGDRYLERNRNPRYVLANIGLFRDILRRTGPVDSVIEFGANIGLNLIALRSLSPGTRFTAVEINRRAAEELRSEGIWTVVEQSILDFEPDTPHQLSLSKGLLIHLDPDGLPRAYDRLYRSTSKFVVLAEYYNPTPVEVPYRGHRQRLFKRDFAGEMLDRYEDLELVDYGFVYHRDPLFPQDDLNWFLLRKNRPV